MIDFMKNWGFITLFLSLAILYFVTQNFTIFVMSQVVYFGGFIIMLTKNMRK